MIAPLLVRPKFDIGDGANGYMLKLTSVNGCTVSDLRTLGISLATLADWGLCTPAGREALDRVRSLHWRLSMAKGYDHRLYCPLCLGEGRVSGIECEMAFCIACPRHGIRLRYSCEECESTPTWLKGDSTHCQCGSDLRTHSTQTAPHAEVVIAEILLKAAMAGTANFDVFENLNLRQWFALLQFLALTKTKGFVRYRTGRARLFPNDAAEAAKLVNDASTALLDWPMSFIDWVADLQNGPGAVQSTRITQVFAPVYTQIYVNLKTEVFAPVRSEFEAYISENWWSGLSTRNSRIGPLRKPKGGAASQWLTIAEVRRKLNLGHPGVLRLIESGTLESQLDVIGERSYAYVTLASVDRYAADRANLVSVHDAAEMLCISRDRGHELAHALAACRADDTDASEILLRGFSKSFLNTMLEVIESLPIIEHIAEDEITFDTVLRGSRLSVVAVGKLLEKIIGREIPMFGRYQTLRQSILEHYRDRPADSRWAVHGGVSSIVFARSDLEFLKAKRTESSEMTVQQVAEQLGVKDGVVYHLINIGLLDFKKSDERFPRKMIKDSEVQKFQSNYVLGPLAARKFGLSSIALRKLLAEAGVTAECSADKDGCRLLIFKNDQAYQAATHGLLRLQHPS